MGFYVAEGLGVNRLDDYDANRLSGNNSPGTVALETAEVLLSGPSKGRVGAVKQEVSYY